MQSKNQIRDNYVLQSNQVGLIKNDEYKGFFNALMKITREEGVLALYRGYFAYILAVSLKYPFKTNR